MIDYNTFHNNMSKTKEIRTISHKVSNNIDCLMLSENDAIRTQLFETAKSFYDIVTSMSEEDFIWQDDKTRIDFEEFIEYVNNDRELMINWLIETELEYIHGKTSEQVLIDAINKIEEFDRRYLIMLLDNRKLLNTYV